MHLHEGLGAPTQRAGIDHRGEAAQHAGVEQLVHPALDGGRGQPDYTADLRIAGPRVGHQPRHDLPVDGIHAQYFDG